MVQEITVENGLALLVEPDRGVKRLLAAGRHQAPQKGNDRRRHRVVHHEVDISKLEQPIQTLRADDDGIGVDRTIATVQQGYGERSVLV